MNNFEDFFFFSNENFPCENDYFDIIVKPISPENIEQAYFNRMKNLAHCLSIMHVVLLDDCQEFVSLDANYL
jgi:hypothetical protein